jgi:DNA-binding HxlR family transcriptional regulator
MSEHLCQVCNEIYDGNTQTIELSDDKNKIHITGHISCTDRIFNEIRNVKDLKKKNVNQILKEINFIL